MGEWVDPRYIWDSKVQDYEKFKNYMANMGKGVSHGDFLGFLSNAAGASKKLYDNLAFLTPSQLNKEVMQMGGSVLGAKSLMQKVTGAVEDDDPEAWLASAADVDNALGTIRRIQTPSRALNFVKKKYPYLESGYNLVKTNLEQDKSAAAALYKTVSDPVGTVTNLVNDVKHPLNTLESIGKDVYNVGDDFYDDLKNLF